MSYQSESQSGAGIIPSMEAMLVIMASKNNNCKDGCSMPFSVHFYCLEC